MKSTHLFTLLLIQPLSLFAPGGAFLIPGLLVLEGILLAKGNYRDDGNGLWVLLAPLFLLIGSGLFLVFTGLMKKPLDGLLVFSVWVVGWAVFPSSNGIK